MSISDKIEEIRQKPEHIRVRYVWALVFISMVFVIAIWFFSVKVELEKTQGRVPDAGMEEFLNKFNSSKQSLDDAKGDLNKALEQAQTQEAAE